MTCKNIIHATNAYASYLLPQFQHRVIPTRGQLFAVRAKSSLDRLKHHSWQANWGNEYWFARPEDPVGVGEEYKPPLVLLGGGRDTAGPGLDQYTMDDSVINNRVSKTLKGFLPNLYSDTGLFEKDKEAEMQWVCDCVRSYLDFISS
jgi:glycine/D-amino acid oxidase-like deaminating enzyme